MSSAGAGGCHAVTSAIVWDCRSRGQAGLSRLSAKPVRRAYDAVVVRKDCSLQGSKRMKWSWRIGTIAGIGVYLHFTFLILPAWLIFMHLQQGDSWQEVLHALIFLAALFGIIVLHELGHALTARRYGIKTRDITLLPIGGVARLERMPEDPRQELIVALAGPAVNVVLAFLFLVVLVAAVGVASSTGAIDSAWEGVLWMVSDPDELTGVSQLPVLGVRFLGTMVIVNIMLVLFNMLPAFPMDGGRVLRALLAMRMDYVRATQVAAAIGQGMAILFGLIGLVSQHPFLLFIALFVWIGAAGEASMVSLRYALEGIPVRQAMITAFQTVGRETPLREVAAHILAGFQQDFPVVEDGHVVGVLTKSDLLKAWAEGERSEPIEHFMRTEFEVAAPNEMLSSAFQRLQQCNCHTLPVVDRGQLVGLLDMENVGEFIALRSAMRRAEYRRTHRE